MESLFWGIVLRIAQATLQGAPFIFTGLCIAATFHRLLGEKNTKRIFGSNSLMSLIQSWVIGMILPGCSLGVIPMVKQLRRSGIAVGTIFAFALSSPLFDPLSLLYGLTLSKPFTILAFATCSLVVVTLSGSLFDHWFPDTELPVHELPPTAPGVRRLLAVLVVMAREITGTSAIYIGCGLLGAGLLAACLPKGSMATSMAHENPLSPLLMTLVAIPAYATPMTAMGQLGSMFQHGNSIGAAFTLLTLGAGMNLGLLVWMVVNYGWKQAATWLAMMFVVVIGLSYGIERPLYPADVEPANHTHAFDSYCLPFEHGVTPPQGYLAELDRRLRFETQPHEWAGAALLIGLVTIGVGLKLLDRVWVIETWLNQTSVAAAEARRFDVDVPPTVLAGVGVLGIVAMSLVGCFVYYPAEQESTAELNTALTEALSAALSGKRDQASHWIPVCETWNRRLQVGMYLRHRELPEYHRWKSRILQDRLEELEHMLEDDDPPIDIRRQVAATSRAFSRLRQAHSPTPHATKAARHTPADEANGKPSE